MAAAGQLRGGGGASPLDEALAQAQELFNAGNFAEASAIFEAILQHEPGHLPAMALAGAELFSPCNKPAKARQILERITQLPAPAAVARTNCRAQSNFE